MLGVDSRGTPTNGGRNDGLVPLPKRVAATSDESGPAISDPIQTVSDLIGRAAQLVATLEHDVEGLKSDQEEGRQRIEQTWEAQQTRAEQAMETLSILRGMAERLAERKARPDLLRSGLTRKEITNFPYDETTPFDTVVEAIDREVRMAKGITGLIRMEGIGELLAAATRRVDRLLADADATKKTLLTQTQDELTAERKEARASFEIGLQVLRRDLDLLNKAVPVSARPWDDVGWENRVPQPLGRCLVRVGNYVHPRLRNTPIPAVLELPGGPGVVFEGTHTNDRIFACIRSVIARALWATAPGGLRITIIDPKGSSDGLRPLLHTLLSAPGTPIATVVATEDTINETLDNLTVRTDRIIEEVLGARFATLTECNEAAGETVEPWHLLLVLDHPSGLSDRATGVLASLIERGPRTGLSVLVVTDPVLPPPFGADGRQRRRQPLPDLERFKPNEGDVVVDRGHAGRWTVQLDDAPSDADAADLIREVSLTSAPTLAADTMADSFDKVLKLSGTDLDDPSTWWTHTTDAQLSVPIGRAVGADVAELCFDGSDNGSALVTSHDTAGIDSFLATCVDGIAVRYAPKQARVVLLSISDRASFDAPIETQLPHARLIGVHTETEFVVSVLEGLNNERTRRSSSRAVESSPVDGGGRLLVVIKGFSALLTGQDRFAVRAVELIDTLLTNGHRVGIHLLLADTDIDDALFHLHPALRRCHTRIDLTPASETAIVLDGASGTSVASTKATITIADNTTTFRPASFRSAARERLLWEARARAHDAGVHTPPQVFDGRTPARLDRSGVERLASFVDRRAQRLKPRFWLGDPTSMGGPVELLLRRTEGANVLVVTNDEFSGRGLVLAAITTAVLNHGDGLQLTVADFLPAETGFAESVQALETSADVTLVRQRRFDEALTQISDTVRRRHAEETFNEGPVVLVVAGLGRARDLDIDPHDPDAQARHASLQHVLSEGPEVGVHTMVWCEAPATLSRRIGRAELREFAYRVVGPLDPDISRGLTGSENAASLSEHQAILYDEEAGRSTKFRPYRPPSPEWLRALVGRAAAASHR